MFALELTLSEACLLCTFRSETLINFYISCSGCCLFIRRTCSSCHFDFNGTTLTIFTNECYYPYYLLAFNLKCVDFQGNLYSSLLLWKFQLSLVNLFYFFRLREPPPPPLHSPYRKFHSLLCGEYGYFLELHKVALEFRFLEFLTFIYIIMNSTYFIKQSHPKHLHFLFLFWKCFSQF